MRNACSAINLQSPRVDNKIVLEVDDALIATIWRRQRVLHASKAWRVVEIAR